MNLILFDDPEIRANLYPFTLTRPVASIRTGILTIAEKWEKHLDCTASWMTNDYLREKFPMHHTDDNVMVNGAVCPTKALVDLVRNLAPGAALVYNKMVIAIRTHEDEIPEVIAGPVHLLETAPVIVDRVWRIFQLNGEQIRADFNLITGGRKSASIEDQHTRTYAQENIFLEEGVSMRAAILNAEAGPIYLGKNVSLLEGAIIKGPFAACEGAQVNMGAKMRGDVTAGPFSRLGGEVSSAVIFAHSNKVHDGFLGCAVLGEWCNLGADTNNSNLKNNYDTVKMWNHARKEMMDTGVQFIGLMMGDHSKSGINTMFNTGTVVGVSANIFGGGFPPNYIPSFAWGGGDEWTTFRLPQAIETARRVLQRKNIELDNTEVRILEKVFALDASFRK